MELYLPSAWSCTVATTTDCVVTATSLAASSTVPYGDWLFVNSIMLFCVAFIPIGILIALIRIKK